MAVANRNLWTAPLRREQLIELLEGRGPRPTPVDPNLQLRAHEVTELQGIWYAEKEAALSPLPQALVGHPTVLEDIFAWSTSYLRELGPLSSIIRPITIGQFDEIKNRTPPHAPWKIAGGAIGLIVGEILAYGAKAEISDAVAAVPNTTLAFAILRAWQLGFPRRAIGEICHAYMRLFVQAPRNPSILIRLAVEQVAYTLVGIDIDNPKEASQYRRPAQWMRDLLAGESPYNVAKDVLRQSADLLSSRDVSRLEEMTAEDRVRLFDRLAPGLSMRAEPAPDRLEKAFALALAAFICRPGFEQQAGLLREYTFHLPEAWLWLGALQAFSPIANALLLGSGGGMRISRELFRLEELWNSPRADASIGELEVLSRSKSKSLERLSSRSRLEIEIYPMITTTLRGLNIGSQPQDETMLESATSWTSAASGKIEDIEMRLQEALRLIRDLRRNEVDTGTRPSRRRR